MTFETQILAEEPTEADKIDAVLEEYGAWFLGIVRRATYPAQIKDAHYSETPGFDEWVKVETSSSLQDIKNLNEDIKKLAERILEDAKQSSRPPDFEDFDKFVTFYEEFTHLMRRLVREHQQGESGFDPITGFRNGELFFKDIVREIDRVARQGKSFCVVLARIDDFDVIATNDEQSQNALKESAAAIKKCLRSFDDAYRVEKGEFILSLKQTGIGGGMKALYRIQGELSRMPFEIKTPKGNKFLSLSFCIAEPLPEDDIRQILNNMTHDMNASTGQAGAITEYFEMSPLQRLLKESRE